MDMVDQVSYQAFRQNIAADLSFQVNKCEVTIQLLEKPNRAKYIYSYDVTNLTGQPVPEWSHIIPAPGTKVTSISATDEKGGLQFTVSDNSQDKTELEIKFRNELEAGQSYNFEFSYESRTNSIVTYSFITQVIIYTDWFINDAPCKLLKITINLPNKSNLLKSVPPSNLDNNSIIYSEKDLRPLEYFSVLASYKRTRLGRNFWQWLGSAIVSGMVGVILTVLFTAP